MSRHLFSIQTFGLPLILALTCLSSCSTLTTTIGRNRTNNLVVSGARYSVTSLIDFIRGAEGLEDNGEGQLAAVSVLAMVLVDFPLSLAADVVILPITIPYTLLHSDEQAEVPHAAEEK